MNIKLNTIEKDLAVLTETTDENIRSKLNVIIEKLPDTFKNLIEEGFMHKRVPKEYTLSSILYSVSSAIGKHFYIDELGYKNYCNAYFIIVGSRGDAKSEAINLARKPITEFDNKMYEDYKRELEYAREDEKPIRKQILIQNSTIEKAHEIHYNNYNGIGIYYDEVRPIIQKMNSLNSRDGIEWEALFLESFTNNVIDVSRKTSDSFRIEKGYLTFIGGIQNQFLKDLFSDSLVASGFVDRLLFTTCITSNHKISFGNVSTEVLEEFNLAITRLLEYKQQSEKKNESIKERRLLFTDQALKKLHQYSQFLLDSKLGAQPPLKEYYSKLMIYIHKFCILCFLMRNAKEGTFKCKIEIIDVDFAILFIEFYILNFKKVISLQKTKEKEPTPLEVINLAKKNGASQKSTSEVLNYSKGQVSKLWNRS